MNEDEKAKASGGIAYDFPDGDKSLVHYESAEGTGSKVMTFYQMIRTAEDKGIVKYGVSNLEVSRDPTAAKGTDSFTLKRTAPKKFFKFQKEDGKKTDNKLFYRDIDAGLLPNADLTPAFRFRFEKVGKNFKPMKVYVATKRSITLKAGRPKKVI